VTSRKVVFDTLYPRDREVQAAAMRQAALLLRLAHKLGPAEHVQGAERFLCDRIHFMITVRAQLAEYVLAHRKCKQKRDSALARCRAGTTTGALSTTSCSRRGRSQTG